MRDAVESDLVAHVAALYAPPAGEVHHDPGAIWFITGDDSPHHNGILKSDLESRPFSRRVDELLEPFDRRRVPMMWWFFTGSEGLAPGIHDLLGEAGFVLDSDRPSMELALDDFETEATPSGLDIARVKDDGAFRAWSEVVGLAFDSPDHWSSISTSSLRRLGWGDDAPFRHYLCRKNDRAVGAATLSLAGGVAGLANISTIPEVRRQGIGRAVTAALLVDAKDLGLDKAALSSDEAGFHLYRSLGFQEIGRHLTYVRELEDRR